MSMRDKVERDKLRISGMLQQYSVNCFLGSESVLELLTIADERDELAKKLKQEEEFYVLLHNASVVLLEADKQKTARIQELQAELTQEQNATWEWQTIAEGMEKELARQKAGNKKLADRMIYAEAYLESHMDTFNEGMKNSVALKAELERLRKAVPGDVLKAIDVFKHTVYLDTRLYINEREALCALIGSLIERKREDLEEAWLAGAIDAETSMDWDREQAKAYADRKMKEGE